MNEFKPGLANKTTAITPEHLAPSNIDQLIMKKKHIITELLSLSREQLLGFLGITIEKAGNLSEKDLINNEISSLEDKGNTQEIFESYSLNIGEYKRKNGL